MAARRDRNNHRAAPYPPRTTNPPPSISKFTPINAPLQIPLPPVGGSTTPQWGLKSHAALREAPIGSSTVRMLVGDTTQQQEVPMTGSNAGDASDLEATLYDVDPDETAYGAPTAADLQYWTRSAAQFIRSSSGIDATWVGKRPLGQGSFGIAGVWEKYDHNGNMVDVRTICRSYARDPSQLTRSTDRGYKANRGKTERRYPWPALGVGDSTRSCDNART